MPAFCAAVFRQGRRYRSQAAKPKQDQRFDIPGFGTTTIESMIHAGATGAVIEAGNTIIPEREKVIALADEHNITILVK